MEADLADMNAALLAAERQILTGRFYEFVKAAWPYVEPGIKFKDNWHIEVLCDVLQGATGKSKRNNLGLHRLIVNIPPGTMKSLIVSVLFPAWVWTRDASRRFMLASYGAHLSTRDNLKCRQLIESQWYQEHWSVKLVDDQNTKTRYNTTEKGYRVSTSVGGVGTGEHPDFIIVDDPHSATDAMSDTLRSAANQWFDNTLSTRLGRNPVIIVVMQRLHEDDLTGHLLKRSASGEGIRWAHVRWPMRFECCTCPTAPDCAPDQERRCPLHQADPTWEPDPRDRRTVAGQLLFESLFPEEKVRQLELDLGPYGAAGQLQQRPAPEGGGLFKRGWFKFADAAPALKRVVRGWDTAGTEDGGDYTVGAKVSEEFEWRVADGKRELVSTGRIFVEDVQRDQLGPAGVDALIKATAQLDGKTVPVREEREGGASGKAVIAGRAKLLAGFDYQEVNLGVNKVVRAKVFRSQCEAGNVYLVRALWNEPYLVELCAFPTGKHDDQVDATSCAYNAMLLEPPPRKVKWTF